MRILISACLLGTCCRYDGKGKPDPACIALKEKHELIPVCPEQLGGLATPRSPAERLGDRVVTREGHDVTECFARGAREVCRLAELLGAEAAVLKARSPSCGVGTIYDGSFTKTVVAGDGAAAEALRRMGLPLYTEDQLDELEEMDHDTL